MGPEDPCGIFLAGGDRTGMVEQRAEHAALDPHIDAEHILAQEVEKGAPCRMLGEGDAALVSRCRPGMLAKPGIIREHARIGRQELRLVAMDRC